MTDEQFRKGQYSKYGLTKSYVEHVRSRCLGPDNKVYSGEAGNKLRERQQTMQKYYESKNSGNFNY